MCCLSSRRSDNGRDRGAALDQDGQAGVPVRAAAHRLCQGRGSYVPEAGLQVGEGQRRDHIGGVDADSGPTHDRTQTCSTQQRSLQRLREIRPDRFSRPVRPVLSWSPTKIQRTLAREGPCQGKRTLGCSRLGRPARASSNAMETREE